MATMSKQKCPTLKKKFHRQLTELREKNFKESIRHHNKLLKFFLYPSLRSRYFKNNKNNMKYGDEGESKVSDYLRANLDDDWHLINKAYIKQDKHKFVTQVDHILFSHKGIYVIETKNWYGDIRGYRDEWKVTSKFGDNQYKSPTTQARKYAQYIEGFLFSKGIQECVTPCVVFVGKSTVTHSECSAKVFSSLDDLIYHIDSVDYTPMDSFTFEWVKTLLENPDL